MRRSRLAPGETYRRTGGRLEGYTPAAKTAWLRTNAPDIFAATRLFVSPKDCLRIMLGGDPVTDPLDAAGTLLWFVAFVVLLALGASPVERKATLTRARTFARLMNGAAIAVAYAASDQAVEDWARTEGHMAQPEDQAVIPVPQPGTVPIQQPSPTPVPTPMANWQVWWNLFFSE